MEDIANVLQNGPVTFGLLAKTAGIGRDRLTRLAGMMVQAGKLSIKEVEVRGKPTIEYALAV
jgi:tape measure domain-containing protein